jgi:hypothetical protein
MQAHDNSIVIYPKVGLWAGGSHHNLIFNFYGESPKAHPRSVQDPVLLFEEIGREARNSTLDVLISSEWLARRNDVGKFVQGLMPYLGSTPLEVEILFVCREHFERAASLYAHGLKGWEKRDPDQFLLEESKHFCYAPLAQKLSNSGLKVTALNYHPSHDCVARFLRYIGFPHLRIPEISERNVALNPRGLIATLAANRIVNSNKSKRLVRNSLTTMAEPFSSSQFIFGPDAGEIAGRSFMADREFLEDNYGIKLPARCPELEPNGFSIDREDLEYIADALRDLGPQAKAIVDIASRYLRD